MFKVSFISGFLALALCLSGAPFVQASAKMKAVKKIDNFNHKSSNKAVSQKSKDDKPAINTALSLSKYVNKPDSAYSFKIYSKQHRGSFTIYTIHLISQKWESITWKHWMRIIVPDNLKHKHQALLVVTGGKNRKAPKKIGGKVFSVVAPVVQRTGAVVAVISQVPNQPLFGGKKEDSLLAYTFKKYLDGGSQNWPALFPMVKSAVKAMDTTQRVLNKNNNLEIKKFIVTGASKRGWTTWLTGAADKRVEAIAPMVIDMLNTKKQMRHQLTTYGKYSPMIQVFAKYNVLQRFNTARGKKLLQAIDPFSYLNKLTMPKLILSGTNDPYWTVDADNLYFPKLKGESRLSYVPNAGHGLSLSAIPTLISFINLQLDGQKLPKLSWHHDDNLKKLTVNWDNPKAVATLWQATSKTRDFRKAHWKKALLKGETSAEAKVTAPKTGWLAYYVTVKFPSPNPCRYSTTMTVIPKRFPYKLEKVNGNIKVKSANTK